MRVWLYYRLSRDEDMELNSLNNQRNILVDYAKSKKYEIVGESFDDNISGMHFDREGIDEITKQAEKRTIDAVVVKDLSRLGRHRTLTSLYIDFLRQHDVRVLSVTENIDTSNENDDLLVGFKGIINDLYSKDISKKIRAGYIQKQKSGIVITTPMGYYKDKNTNSLYVVDEEADIVRKIYDMYLSGYGLGAIANKLNSEGIKSPQYYQNTRYDKSLPYTRPKIGKKYLWTSSTVKRILTNELYIGTLVCHKTTTSKIHHTRKETPVEERFIHENYAPVIIEKDKWEQVQFLLQQKVANNVRASSGNPCHRYTGLIQCGDCGCTFICKKRKWRDQPVRMEYNCNGYHRYSKNHCTAHRIDEDVLDDLIYKELMRVKAEAIHIYESVEAEVKNWFKEEGNTKGKLQQYYAQLEQQRADQKELIIEKIRDRKNSDIYDELLKKCEESIRLIQEEISALEDYETTVKKRKSEIKSVVELIDDVLSDGAVSDANLRLLVNKIIITEEGDKLDVHIKLNAKFTAHTLMYDENGKMTDVMLSA